jgi:hypothetical protein
MKLIKLAVAVGFLWGGMTVASAQVVTAKISGPVPTSASSQPYRGTNEQPVAGPGLPIPDLLPYGYVEEEYFVSGMVDGKPYTTSMLVRKPKDPRKFSGLVAVETVHAQGAVPFWGFKDLWMRGGHGWIAVGSQRVALEQYIRKSNPKRYESLQLPEAPATPGQNPMGGGAQDLISQAIMTQVGALLKSNATNGPFRGMTVKWLVMGGASQTGGTTLRYIQNSHATAKLANGKYIYDGYMPELAFPATPLPPSGVPIMHVATECDLMNSIGAGRVPVLRPDADTPTDKYRHYEYAGASHVGMRGIKDPLQVFPTLAGVLKPGEHLSQFPQAEVVRPAAVHFIDWVMKGTAPPHAPGPIQVANGQILRDGNGNAKGGVRSPYVDTPTVRYIAAAPTAQGENLFRRLIGLEEPFSADKLKALYKTRANYLRLFSQGIDKMRAGGWLLQADAQRLKAEEVKNPAIATLP